MHINGKAFRTIWFDEKDQVVKIIDQTKLPHKFEVKNLKAVKDAVRNGRLKLKVIEEKIERVKACKKAHFKSYEPIYIPSIAKVLNSETQNKLLGKINLEA